MTVGARGGSGWIATGDAAGPVEPGLDADVRAQRGPFDVGAHLVVPRGRVLALVGPNGAGKSTLLDVVAGRLRPVAGIVRVGDRVLTDAARHVHVAPERRSVALLGQDALVFPHLSVRENVAFAPRAAGVPAGRARAGADAWIEAVGLGGLGHRRPAQLSGGQRQRVALARALAAEPEVLLLDEPFAQLDVTTAAELRDVVRGALRRTGTTAVLVTHDVLDAVALADELAVLVDGVVVEHGAPLDVLDRPQHPFTAALAGVNVVVGETSAGLAAGLVVVAGPVRLPCPAGVGPGLAVRATFAPSAVRVVEREAGSAPEVTWQARVVAIEAGAAGVVVRTDGDVLVDVTPTVVANLDLRAGSMLELAVPVDLVRLRVR